MIDTYKETLQGLFRLKEKKELALQSKELSGKEKDHLRKQISILQQEIYEVEEVIFTLERGKGNGKYTYRHHNRFGHDVDSDAAFAAYLVGKRPN